MAAPMKPNPRFNLNTPVNGLEFYDQESKHYSYTDKSLLEMEKFGVLPHENVPSLIGGFDDEQSRIYGHWVSSEGWKHKFWYWLMENWPPNLGLSIFFCSHQTRWTMNQMAFREIGLSLF
ncbi:hypothetical protein ACFX1S_036232 [Malus domestica]